MTHGAIYNEIDPFAARWLDALIDTDNVGPGRVDTRSIEQLGPADVDGPGQRHFFAGIGGWSLALRRAGVADDESIWTGSCPCQPFSGAGQRKGVRDPRHLWPAWFELIRECRPPAIFGEQVASRDGLAWLDLVRADLERCGYAFGASDLCAAGVGAPHIRSRLYFVAYADGKRLERVRVQLRSRRSRQVVSEARRSRDVGKLADRNSEGLEVVGEQQARRQLAPAERGLAAGELADAECDGGRARWIGEPHGRSKIEPHRHGDVGVLGDVGIAGARRDAGAVLEAKRESARQRFGARYLADSAVAAGPARGFWSDADWVVCRDEKARPVEPGTFPLAHGIPGRVGRLRGYGNAINIEQAAAFIDAAIGA